MSTEQSKQSKGELAANGLFLIWLGVLFYTNWWWPGILLALWSTIAVRQYVRGNLMQLLAVSVILLGLFFASFFQMNWSLFIPILFILAGVYLVGREFYFFSPKPKE